MGEYCRQKQLEFQSKGILGRREVTPDMFSPKPKKLKTEIESDVKELQCAFIRACYSDDSELPKTKLINWCKKNKLESPKYKTINEDKLFRSIVTVNGSKYSSSYWYVYIGTFLL